MTGAFDAYIICGTPRSGSTLLCEMLWATRAVGRPNSYFREQDIVEWADQWSVPHPDGIEDAAFDRNYLQAMHREGCAGTPIFGIRIMWPSMAEAKRRLYRATQKEQDFTGQFEARFGRTLYVHVSRHDKIAQAVSRLRAEQSGIWHLGADGRVLEGAQSPNPIAYDGARLAMYVAELEEHDAAWSQFFAERSIEPIRLSYETTVAAPRTALETVLSALGVNPSLAKNVAVPTAQMSDATNQAWVDRFKEETRSSV